MLFGGLIYVDFWVGSTLDELKKDIKNKILLGEYLNKNSI